MAFSTQIFTFVFLPLFIFFITLSEFLKKIKCFSKFFNKTRADDLLLIIISFAFYSWACFDDFIFLFLYILAVFVLGKIINIFRNSGLSISLTDNSGKSQKKISLAVILLILFSAIIVFILTRFKYMGIVNKMWNLFFGGNWASESLMAPLGISFITFSAISYSSLNSKKLSS